jgi:hypothetical protein
MPNAVIVNGTKPQEIVQFIIQYRYISKDGREAPVDTYDIITRRSRASFLTGLSLSLVLEKNL